MKNDVSTAKQRARLLAWLRKKPITTFQARHKLDIIGVAPRIYELRWYENLNIKTFWVEDSNPGGGRHLVARYVLLPGVWRAVS